MHHARSAMKYTHFLWTALLTTTAAKVYTGFNYGAFWSHESNVKRYADFHQGFELAKNLTNTPVPFDSARLYTCITAGTQNDPTEAFQASIDTGTYLLLGMWISPGASGQSNDAQIGNELAALEKGFELHGQRLADLVIGLSVGNEDVYRFNNAAAGVGNVDLQLTLERVRKSIAASSYAKYMQGKPVGHTDTTMYAIVPGSDFTGMTAYPYWEGKSIDDAAQSFMFVLEDTQRRAGTSSVWISEMGWPINGAQNDEAVASTKNYQRYWDEVGCQVFGKYNTFWFELLQDSQPDQPDWGLLDSKTHQPRIRDLSCGNISASRPVSSTSVKPQPTTLSSPTTKQSITTPPLTKLTTRTTITLTTTIPATDEDATLYLTTTTTIYTNPAPTPTSNSTTEGLSVCITMLDLLGDGVFIPVVTHRAAGSDCDPPPQLTGSPFTLIAPTELDGDAVNSTAGSTPSPISSSSAAPLFDDSLVGMSDGESAVPASSLVVLETAVVVPTTLLTVTIPTATPTVTPTETTTRTMSSVSNDLLWWMYRPASTPTPIPASSATTSFSHSLAWWMFAPRSTSSPFPASRTLPVPAASTTTTFSHSLAWSMFAPRSTSSPIPLSIPTPSPTSFSHSLSWWMFAPASTPTSTSTTPTR
ncbi:hypothetical protein N0V95_008074 [Ascochyta clinopodiicola]|nr:hypothetical protein N0V95_008074 [Ascochyta clinopodiicola]